MNCIVIDKANDYSGSMRARVFGPPNGEPKLLRSQSDCRNGTLRFEQKRSVSGHPHFVRVRSGIGAGRCRIPPRSAGQCPTTGHRHPCPSDGRTTLVGRRRSWTGGRTLQRARWAVKDHTMIWITPRWLRPKPAASVKHPAVASTWSSCHEDSGNVAISSR